MVRSRMGKGEIGSSLHGMLKELTSNISSLLQVQEPPPQQQKGKKKAAKQQQQQQMQNGIGEQPVVAAATEPAAPKQPVVEEEVVPIRSTKGKQQQSGERRSPRFAILPGH